MSSPLEQETMRELKRQKETKQGGRGGEERLELSFLDYFLNDLSFFFFEVHGELFI